MKAFAALLAVLALAGCAQPQYSEYMTPAERTARMQAAAALLGATRMPVSQPVVYQAPVYQAPVYIPMQTNCMRAGVLVSCTTY